MAVWTLAALLPFGALAQETIVLRDGSTFDGRMVGATERSITFRDNSGQMHRFDVDHVQSIQFQGWNRNNSYGNNYQGANNGYPAVPPGSGAQYGNNGNGYQNGYGNNYPNQAYPQTGQYAGNQYGNSGYSMMVPAGTSVSVRTNESINARDASQGTSYSAQVSADVVGSDGNVLIPQGSDARLIVRRTNDNSLVLDLQSVRVNGQRYVVNTSDIREQGEGVGANKRTGEYVGGGAVLGTLLGAIAGGGKGAAIGALAGAGAGAGAEVLTRGDQVKVPAETVLTFRLDRPLYLNAAQ
jgi:hypothetical protein